MIKRLYNFDICTAISTCLNLFALQPATACSNPSWYSGAPHRETVKHQLREEITKLFLSMLNTIKWQTEGGYQTEAAIDQLLGFIDFGSFRPIFVEGVSSTFKKFFQISNSILAKSVGIKSIVFETWQFWIHDKQSLMSDLHELKSWQNFPIIIHHKWPRWTYKRVNNVLIDKSYSIHSFFPSQRLIYFHHRRIIQYASSTHSYYENSLFSLTSFQPFPQKADAFSRPLIHIMHRWRQNKKFRINAAEPQSQSKKRPDDRHGI